MVRYSRGNIMEDIEARLKLLREKKKIDTKGISGKANCGAQNAERTKKSKKNNVCKNICNNNPINQTFLTVQLTDQLMSRKSPV